MTQHSENNESIFGEHMTIMCYTKEEEQMLNDTIKKYEDVGKKQIKKRLIYDKIFYFFIIVNKCCICRM